MTGKTLRLAGFSFFCLLLAAYRAPLGAVLTGGILKIFAFSAASGGGRASGGAVVLSAANIGGLTASGTVLTGGSLSVTTGGTPGMIAFEMAKDNLSAAHCYPVPFKPSAGHKWIFFTNLTRATRIRIYTISGELVRTLDKSDPYASFKWDVRNSKGSAVGSGVYLYLMESAVETKKGKLMIIR